MNVSVENHPDCKATMRVEVDAEVVASARADIVRDFARHAKLPGFRPGKVPASVIAKRFAKDIAADVEDRVIDGAVREAVKQEQLQVLSFGKADQRWHNPDGTFSFAMDVVLAPTFELPEYRNIPVKAPRIEITDANLDEVLEDKRKDFATYSDVVDRSLQMGDFAVIDYVGTIGDQSVGEVAPDAPAQFAQASEHWLQMDEKSFFPTFCGQLVGMAADDVRDVTVTFPDDFRVEILRGREIAYHVTLRMIKEQVLPDLDDAFAERVAGETTLAELRDTIRARMETDLKYRIEDFSDEQIRDYLDRRLEFELPREAVMSEAQVRVNRIVEYNARRGIAEAEIQEQREDIIQAAAAQAKRSVKVTFVLAEIARRERLDVDPEHLAIRIARMAEERDMPMKKLLREMEQTGEMRDVRFQLLIEATMEFLRDHADVEILQPKAPDEPEKPEDPESPESPAAPEAPAAP